MIRKTVLDKILPLIQKLGKRDTVKIRTWSDIIDPINI